MDGAKRNHDRAEEAYQRGVGSVEARDNARTAFFAEQTTVGWQEAVGRVCAEVVAPYPPGVPVLVPGELIDAETLDVLRTLAAQGTRVAYAADPSLDTFRVVVGSQG